jgi:hypothetical protein
LLTSWPRRHAGLKRRRGSWFIAFDGWSLDGLPKLDGLWFWSLNRLGDGRIAVHHLVY